MGAFVVVGLLGLLGSKGFGAWGSWGFWGFWGLGALGLGGFGALVEGRMGLYRAFLALSIGLRVWGGEQSRLMGSV